MHTMNTTQRPDCSWHYFPVWFFSLIRKICTLAFILVTQAAFAQTAACVDESVEAVKPRLMTDVVQAPKSPGLIAFERKRYDFAYKELSSLPIKDMQSQYYLGVMTEQGLGTSKSPQGAMRWYLRAAESGSPQAQFALGKLFSGSADFPKNYAEAATWFQRSAEQGFGEAQLRLGLMYRDGMGKPQDMACALAWVDIATNAQVDGASAAQKNILKRTTPEERASSLQLKARLQSKLDQKTK